MATREKILAIDDEDKVLKLIRDVLNETYDVVVARSGEDGIDLAQSELPSLILVDKIMPKMDGIETTRFIRKCAATKNIPLVMLTALKESKDRAQAFEAGVDDFISKPFHPDELLTRINAKISRFKSLQGSSSSPEIVFGNLRINLEENVAYVNDKLVPLAPKEFDILRYLLSKKGKIQSREKMLSEIWREGKPDPRALDAHVANLRKKIRRFNGKISAVYGRGYVIRDE